MNVVVVLYLLRNNMLTDRDQQSHIQQPCTQQSIRNALIFPNNTTSGLGSAS
jgi:hypothetical protein